MPTLATASAPQDDEQIGYGKPPKSGQFKPGQSGNPKGRPKGRKGVNTIIDDVFRKKVSLREGGKVKKISQVEALFRRVMNDALKGDPKATDQALKLLQMMNNMREQSAFGDDGTTPDLAADLEAIEQMLALHDVTVPPAEEGGGDYPIFRYNLMFIIVLGDCIFTGLGCPLVSQKRILNIKNYHFARWVWRSTLNLKR